MYGGPPQGPPGGYGPPPPYPVQHQYPQQQYPQQYYPPQQPVMYVQQNTVMVKAPFNHTIHIVLDVLTCGGWLPIHLICWAIH